MDLKQIALGIVIFVVFWGFHLGIFNPLGPSGWVLGVIIFSLILWLMGRSVMPKRQPPEMVEIWNFSVGLAIVATVIIAYGGPVLGAVIPSGAMPDLLTPFVLSLWLIIFGAASFATGWTMKWGVTTETGIIWLFASLLYLMPLVAANAYLHFGFVTSLPFIIYGLVTKG